jgi:hypothetical protein
MTEKDALLRDVLDALARATDPAKLHLALGAKLAGEAQAPARGAAAPARGAAGPGDDVLGRLVLADILDDAILGARPGEKGYLLRTFFSRMGEALHTDTGFLLSCAMNVYFRAPMDEEVKMRLGVEASRAFYRFAEEQAMERERVAEVAPLVATLLSGELARVRLESVDHMAVFDSQVHERDAGADAGSARIVRPRSFLCRVAANNMVRLKAQVLT